MDQGMHNVVSEPRPQLEAHRDQQAREMRAALQELYLLLEPMLLSGTRGSTMTAPCERCFSRTRRRGRTG